MSSTVMVESAMDTTSSSEREREKVEHILVSVNVVKDRVMDKYATYLTKKTQGYLDSFRV